MKKQVLYSLAFLGFLAACEVQDAEVMDQPVERQTRFNGEINFVKPDFPTNPVTKMGRSKNTKSNNVIAKFKQYNELLEPYGVQIEKMELYSIDGMGKEVFFSDRGNKQLGSDWVPNDPRNPGGADVPYLIDDTQAVSSVTGLNIIAPTISAMDTWTSKTCSAGLDIPFAGTTGVDVGIIPILLGYGQTAGFAPGFITHAGVMPQDFFVAFGGPGGGTGILGVCFTLIYTDGVEPTDIDQNGKSDVAIKEIYYNDFFPWTDAVASGGGVDFETVALHEAGHALSQEHFGELFRTDNGKFHFAPRALMNAGYTGVNRVVEKTDEAGHCSNWGNWPNN